MTTPRSSSSKFVKVQPTKDTRNGKATQVRFRVRREDGSFRETSETFYDNIEAAEKFAADIRRSGAEKALAELGAENQPRQLKADALTVEQWVTTYIDSISRGTQDSKAQLHSRRRVHITPSIGAIPLTELTYEDISTWVGVLSTSGRVGNSGRLGSDGIPLPGLKPSSVAVVFKLLWSALNAAVFAKKIPENPAINVRLPKEYAPPPLALTKDQFIELRDAFDPHYRLLLEFLVTTGVRWGEVAALHPRDVDVERGEVFIHQSIVRRGKGYALQSHPKTPHSIRTIDAPRSILERLDLDPARGFVFLNTDGSHYRYSDFRYRWNVVVNKLNFPRKPTVHTLRSTYATWQNAAGVDIKTIQHQLGHSSAATTAKFYATRDPLKGKDAVKHLELMLT